MSIHINYQQILVLLCFFCLRAACFENGLSYAVERYNHGETHAQIVLIRHGESEANQKRLFSWATVPLTATGCEEARSAATTLKSHRIKFDRAYTSGFKRAQDSLTITLKTLGYDIKKLPIKKAQELNTRTFGEWTGKPYAQAYAELGSEKVNHWFGIDYKNVPDVAPPGGETLEECENRAHAYYTREINRKVLAGENILVVASRNPIYSIMKLIEGDQLKEVDIKDMKNALPIIYQLDARGKVLQRTMYY